MTPGVSHLDGGRYQLLPRAGCTELGPQLRREARTVREPPPQRPRDVGPRTLLSPAQGHAHAVSASAEPGGRGCVRRKLEGRRIAPLHGRQAADTFTKCAVRLCGCQRVELGGERCRRRQDRLDERWQVRRIHRPGSPEIADHPGGIEAGPVIERGEEVLAGPGLCGSMSAEHSPTAGGEGHDQEEAAGTGNQRLPRDRNRQRPAPFTLSASAAAWAAIAASFGTAASSPSAESARPSCNQALAR